MKKILGTLLLFFTFNAFSATLSIPEIRNAFGLKIGESIPLPVRWTDPNYAGTGIATIFEDHIELKVSVALYGAGYYSRISKADLKRNYPGMRKIPFPIEDFQIKDHIASLSQHPKIAAAVATWKNEFEKAFSHDPRLKIRFEFIFPNEAEELGPQIKNAGSFMDYHLKLLDGLQAKGHSTQTGDSQIAPHAVPIILQALPSVHTATTTFWDPYSIPQLWIHEMGHLLGLHVEGYEITSYPIAGIMNAEPDFQVLKEHGITPALEGIEANSIIERALEQKLSRTDHARLIKMMGITANNFPFSHELDDYQSLTTAQLKARAAKRIAAQLPLHPACYKPLKGRKK